MNQQPIRDRSAHFQSRESLVRVDTAKALALTGMPLANDEIPRWVRVETRDLWVRQDLRDWCVLVRVVRSRNGNPVVGEVRVFPAEDEFRRSEAGLGTEEWSGCYTGQAATVPKGGLTARLLKTVKLGEALRGGLGAMRWVTDGDPEELVDLSESFPRWRLRASRAKRGGRLRIPDEALVKVAAVYAKSWSGGSPNPVVVTARRLKLPRARVRDWLHLARERGLLIPAETTRPHGELTGKGERLLRAMTTKTGRAASAGGAKRRG